MFYSIIHGPYWRWKKSEYELTDDVRIFIGVFLLPEYCPSFSNVSTIIISKRFCTYKTLLTKYHYTFSSYDLNSQWNLSFD